MPSVDWMGEHGGQMATAAAASAAATAGVMTGLGKWIAAKIFEPTIKRLEDELAEMKDARAEDQRRHDEERRRDREECRQETRELRDRIKVLEAFLLQAGGSLRQATQAAISEVRVHSEGGGQ